MGLDGIGKTGFTGYTNKLSQTNINKLDTNISFNKTNSIKEKNDNFYAGMGLNLNKIQKPEAGSLEELQQVLPTLTVANADRADKKAAYDAVQGNDWSSYLTRAYAYGNISEETIGFLNNSEQMDKLNELAGLA